MTRQVQAVIGKFLFYAQIDETMLKALNTLATQQAAPTE